jgi:hypothetical protein
MRKIMLLAGMAAFAYGAARLLVRRPERAPAVPDAPVEAREAPPVGAPIESGPASSPSADEPTAPVPPMARPTIRVLKIADVPAPGAERSPEEETRAAAIDAAARNPRLSAYAGSPGYSATTAPSYRAPDIPKGAAVPASDEPAAAPATREAPRGARAPVKTAARPAGKAVAKTDPAEPPRAVEAPGRSARDIAALASEDTAVARRTDELVGAAKNLTFNSPEATLARDPVGQQILADQKVGSGVRGALEKLKSSGRPVSREEAEDAVANTLMANGIEPTEEEVNLQLALAEQPLPPPPPIESLVDILARMNNAVPDPEARAAIAREAEAAPPRNPDADLEPPRPRGPPPRGAAQAYRIVRDALEKGRRDFGVDPRHSFGIFGVESSFGRNTGRYLVVPVLQEELRTRAPGSARYRQAQRDLAAMVRLEASGGLGPGNTAANMRGSYGASFGHTQFRPSSWEAYGRDPDGGRQRDPYDMRTAVYSTANYLRGGGYSRSVPRAIFSYNRSNEYVRTVLNMSERLQRTVIAPQAER